MTDPAMHTAEVCPVCCGYGWTTKPSRRCHPCNSLGFYVPPAPPNPVLAGNTKAVRAREARARAREMNK